MSKKKIIRIACLLAIILTVLLTLVSCAKKGSATPTYKHQEFDPNESPIVTQTTTSDVSVTAFPALTDAEIQILKDELPEMHAALEQANAEYEAEMAAREADKLALEEANGKYTEWESEKNKLIADLNAKEEELRLKTPPVLDIKKITGTYEAKGELVTLTYNYEVTVESEGKGFLVNKKLLYSVPGTLKIGVNFDNVKNGITTNDTTKTVTVKIPAAYFVSNEIDEAYVQRYNIEKGIFAKVEDKDYLNAAPVAKLKAEELVRNNGMLIYAQRLAGLEFIGILEPITSISGYQIVVVYE